MMNKSIKIYRSAFERLKSGKAQNIDFKKGQKININDVAREAGKAAGSLRRNRGLDYSILCEEIEAYQPQKISNSSRINSRLKNLLSENERLKAQNNNIKSRYQSLLYLNYELIKKLEKNGVNPVGLAPARDIKVTDNTGMTGVD